MKGYIKNLERHEDSLKQRIAQLEAENANLKAAVKALPVKEWVKEGMYGEPVLIGYVMQAQDEWVAVKELLGGD